MRNIGEAKVTVKIDTSAAKAELAGTEAVEARLEQAREDRAERAQTGARGPGRESSFTGQASGPSSFRKAKDIAGRVVGTVRGMRDSTTVLRTTANIIGTLGAMIPIPYADKFPKLAAGALKAANLAEEYGPQGTAIAMTAAERLSGGAFPDAAREAMEGMINALAAKVAEVKSEIDAVFGAGRDSVTIAKAAFLMRSEIDPAEMAKTYGNLFEVHRALNMSNRVQRMIEKRLYGEGLADAMADSLQE